MKIVVFTILFKVNPSLSKIAAYVFHHLISLATISFLLLHSFVSGFIGFDQIKTRNLPTSIPWEYGPIACGAHLLQFFST